MGRGKRWTALTALGLLITTVALQGLWSAQASATGTSVSNVGVAVSTVAAGVSHVTWTYTFTTSSSGGLAANAGTITLTAPSGTAFPGDQNRYWVKDVTTNSGWYASGLAVSSGGATATVTTPVAISAGDSVSVAVTQVANPPAGTYAGSDFTVATSSDTTPAGAATGITLTAPQAPTAVSIASSTDAAGVTEVQWIWKFTASSTGGLAAQWGTITLTAPSGVIFQSDAYRYWVEDVTTNASGYASGVTVSSSGVTATVTTPVAINAGDSVSVTVTQVTNPSAGTYAGSDFTVATSSDTTPAGAATGITLTAPQAPTAVSIASSTDAAGVTEVQWTWKFTASSTGELAAQWGTITLSAPSGTTLPNDQYRYWVEDTTTDAGGYVGGLSVSGGGTTATMATPVTINAGDSVSMTVTQVTDPPAGTYAGSDFTLATSSDTTPAGAVTGITFTAPQAPTGVTVTSATDAAGASGVRWTWTFAPSSTGGLARNFGMITLSAPSGTTLPNDQYRYWVEDTTTDAGGYVGGLSVSNGGATATFGTPVAINAGDAVSVTIDQVTNPPVHDYGNADFSLVTSSDTVPGSPSTGLAFSYPSTMAQGGGDAASDLAQPCSGDPVNCETGNFSETYVDLAVPGRGRPLDLTRAYNSLSAAVLGPFGYGWSDSYDLHLSSDASTGAVTITQGNASTATFYPGSSGYVAPSYVFATLVHNSDGTWTFTRRGRQIFTFSSAGDLLSESDPNGYVTTLSYNSSGQLSSVTDPAGRTLTFTFGASGLVASATDSGGRTVSYGYDANDDLTSVTDVGGGTTTFGYASGTHLLASITDPRGNTLSNTYDGSGRVLSQTDPLSRTTGFAYGSGSTTITEPNGSTTVEAFTYGEMTSRTLAAGTDLAATWHYTYDPYTLGLASVTDPDGHTWSYGYDASGNLTRETDPLGRSTTAVYNGFDEPTTVTDPAGTKTTFAYDGNGNLTGVARPLTGTSQTQTSSLSYGDASHPGDVTAMTNPDGKTWTYTYDQYGDRVAVTDPLGDESTYAYNVLGERTAMVAPDGNVAGADPARYTTTYTFDAFGDGTGQTDPLGHTSTRSYDADRNLKSVTDGNGNTTQYSYDTGNELTAVTRADGSKLSYGYDASGDRTSQSNASGEVTKYAYNALNRLIAMTDPLGRKTTYTYDPAGNRLTMADPSGQTTTDRYDAANELTGTSYSDGRTPDITNITYSADGQRTGMSDGTGSPSWTYDSLNRLTSYTSGAGATLSYGWDLADHLTSVTYPNGKTVNRGYDAAGHLSSVTDWLSHTTSFGYDASGNLTTESYPNATTAAYSFDAASRLTAITYSKAGTPFASLRYGRDANNQLTAVTPTGVSQSDQNYTYTPLEPAFRTSGRQFLPPRS